MEIRYNPPMRKILINTLLVVVSVLVAYGAGEFLFRLALPHLPRHYLHHQPREIRILAQNTKDGLTPSKDYVAIFGDSYGVGAGDWFIDNGYDRESDFQAAHVIRRLTGRDVVSFAKAGSGNYDGTAIFARNAFMWLRELGVGFPDPATGLIYFYAGNDLTDNERFIRRHYQPEWDMERMFDDGHFATFEAEMDRRYVRGEASRTQDMPLLGNFLSRTVEDMLYRIQKTREGHEGDDSTGEINRAVVGGVQVELPDVMEGPALHLDEQRTDRALRVFERACLKLRQTFPQTRLFIVYIPAPLSCYEFASEQVTFDGGMHMYAPREVTARAEALRQRVRSFAQKEEFGFVDLLGPSRALAHRVLLHGPRDYSHYNRAGYELLAREVVKAMTD